MTSPIDLDDEGGGGWGRMPQGQVPWPSGGAAAPHHSDPWPATQARIEDLPSRVAGAECPRAMARQLSGTHSGGTYRRVTGGWGRMPQGHGPSTFRDPLRRDPIGKQVAR